MSTGQGKKRVKNIPVLYDEPKKKRGVMLTDTAWQKIQELALKDKTSASEYLEELIRKYCLLSIELFWVWPSVSSKFLSLLLQSTSDLIFSWYSI
ncbi:MAG: hypothetical protein KME30_09775 [Iphinoe sp. HA4291-MV1]|jgi:hypothetical protein|nr:hypothetical protein [Iphinoe sp. HA4291-MV1]